MNYFLVGIFGNGVVTVFEIEVVGAFATVVVTFGAVVVGGLAPPITGIGVVTVLASVVAGNVVNDNAAFFVFGVVISVSVGESEPPQALIARRAAAVRARAVARGEIFMIPIYPFVIADSRRPWSQPGGALGFEAGDFRFMGHGDANVVETIDEAMLCWGIHGERSNNAA